MIGMVIKQYGIVTVEVHTVFDCLNMGYGIKSYSGHECMPSFFYLVFFFM
jgi:hypothetical protein